jgi:hypothetical protein
MLTDEEILERLPIYTSDDTHPQERAEAAEFLVDYYRGEIAEQAVTQIVDTLPSELLDRLIRDHLFDAPPLALNYCRHSHSIAQRLKALHFRPIRETAQGWRIGWPGGEELKGKDLCRIALLAFWLRRMRSTGANYSMPSY